MKYIAIGICLFCLFSVTVLSQTQTELLVRAGDQFRQDHKYDEAVDEFTKAIYLEPNNVNLYVNRALLYSRLRNKPSVLQDVKKAFSLAPRDRMVLANCDSALRGLFRDAEILEIFDQLVADDNTNPAAHWMRGEKRILVKDYYGAIEDVKKEIELDPLHYWGYSTLYTALGSLKNDKGILDCYEKLFKLFELSISNLEQNPPHFDENEWVKSQEYHHAIENFQYWLRRYLFDCSSIYEERGNISRAQELRTKIGLIGPKRVSYRDRASFYAHTGQFDEALADMAQAIEDQENFERLNQNTERFKGEHKSIRSRMLIQRGDIYFSQGNYLKAIEDYKMSLSLYNIFPEDAQKKIALAEQKLAGKTDR